MTQPRLTEVLARLADDARQARVAGDTWQRAVRRRRARKAVGLVAAVTAVLVGVPLMLNVDGSGGAGRRAAGAEPSRPVVPARVYPPFTGEDTIDESPPGPAAILISGDQELRGSDIWGWEGRGMLVGQAGGYRLVRTVGETSVGMVGLLLSPDGRYLASGGGLEGAEGPEEPHPGTAVFDLSTGAVRHFAEGIPVAWAPDGNTLLLQSNDDVDAVYTVGRLHLLDLRTGRTRALPEIKGQIRDGNVAAFSPDGTRLAVATKDALYMVDLAAGTLARLAGFTVRDRIAGPGAWLPDGRRIATYTVDGCLEDRACTESDLGRRLFRIRYLDAATGQAVDGPELAPARGLAVRMLGWQRDGDAVVAVYPPEHGAALDPTDPYWSETDWWAVGGVRLAEFRPDGSQHNLVDLPDSALFVDVPADLLDRFGGPSRSRLEGGARWLLSRYWPLGQMGVLLVAVALLVIGLKLRRRIAGRFARRCAAHDGGSVEVGVPGR